MYLFVCLFVCVFVCLFIIQKYLFWILLVATNPTETCSKKNSQYPIPDISLGWEYSNMYMMYSRRARNRARIY